MPLRHSPLALSVTIQREIDAIVYRLFDLTPAEVALIETALAPVRGQADTPDDA
jgi:hypothetical protein